MTAVLPPVSPRRRSPGPALPATAGADLQVPLVTGERVEYANLDLAASAPALGAVAEHVAELLPYSSSVHRGAGYASRVCTAVLEQARGTIAGFLRARPDDVVVFTRNTTDALNLLAGCVPGPGAHPRRRAPRQPAAVAARPGTGCCRPPPPWPRRSPSWQAALAAEPTALVAVTGASNVTGEALPLAEIAELAHAAGARLLVDAAQLAPHRRIDIAGTGIDYLALSGHKLYAPFGAGVLVGRRDWLDAGDAVPGRRRGHPPGPPRRRGERRGDRHRRGRNRSRWTWAAAPERHEGGTPNVLGAAALAAACRALDPVLDRRRAGARAGAAGPAGRPAGRDPRA